MRAADGVMQVAEGTRHTLPLTLPFSRGLLSVNRKGVA